MPMKDPGSVEGIGGAARSADPYEQTQLGQIDRRFLNNGIARVVLLVLLGAALIAPSVQFVHKIQETHASEFRESKQRQRSALGRWLGDINSMQNPRQDDPYKRSWLPTTPVVYMLLIPLSHLKYSSAGAIWAILQGVGFVLSLALLIREFGRQGRSIPTGVLAMAGLFAVFPIIASIQHGNVNLFMMVWIALAWAMYMRKSDYLAGLFVSLAIVTKLTPALLLVYFLYKGAWKVCLGTAIGLAIFVLLVPALYFGFGHNIELLRSWFDMLVAPYALHGYVSEGIVNQSLYGVLIRMLHNTGLLSAERMPLEQAIAAGMDDMVRPISVIGGLLRPVISLGFLAALAWLCRTKASSRRDPRLLLEFGLVLLAMLLMSERTWKHHATTLPIVYLGVWFVLTCRPWSDYFRFWCVFGLVAQAILLLLTFGGGVIGDRRSEAALAGGVFCWCLLVCFIQTAIMLRASPRETA